MPYSTNSDRLAKHLLSRIERLSSSVVMPSPCTRCRSSGAKCIFDVDLTSCLACVRLRRPCDVVVPESEWSRSDRLKADLSRRLGEVEDEYLDLEEEKRDFEEKRQKVVEKQRVVLQKRLRLRRAAGLLREKEKKLFATDLAALDEMDRAVRSGSFGLVSSSDDLVVPSASAEVENPFPISGFGESDVAPDLGSPNLDPATSWVPEGWSFSQLLEGHALVDDNPVSSSDNPSDS